MLRFTKYKPDQQTTERSDNTRVVRQPVVKPIERKLKENEQVVRLPGQKPAVVRRKDAVVKVDNRTATKRQLDDRQNEFVRRKHQEDKNNEEFDKFVSAITKLYSPSTYAGAAARSLTGDGKFGENVLSGTGFGDTATNVMFDVASPLFWTLGVKGINTANSVLKNKLIQQQLNRNIRNWDGTVGQEYFNAPNYWYRWTETPEVEGIMEAGMNVTSRDANKIIDVPADRWRLDAMHNYKTSKEGYWYKKDRRPRIVLMKEGSAHGNRTQASYGRSWGGTIANSGIGRFGLLEGRIGPIVPYGVNRSNFVPTPVEDMMFGQRIGFKTGEMPLDGLSWFEKLPNGRFKYEGEVLPYKRIQIQSE